MMLPLNFRGQVMKGNMFLQNVSSYNPFNVPVFNRP